MAIDKNLPEPFVKSCSICTRKEGRGNGLKGILLHWPHKDAKDVVKLPGTLIQEPFSMWLYTCTWCRGTQTKRKKRFSLKYPDL